MYYEKLISSMSKKNGMIEVQRELSNNRLVGATEKSPDELN